MITYNEVKHLNEQIVTSMNEFDQNLTSNENKQQVNISKFLQPFFFTKKFFRMIINYKYFYLMFNNN
jgi:hypothetical protein